MICIKCKRPIDKSYGARELAGCYCQTCAVMCGLTQEAIEKARLESVMVQTEKQILTDIRDYLVAILDEWHRRSDEPNFLENNIMVYNHLRKELDDLTEYAEKLGVEL